MKFFISIAAYRDPELAPTLRHCLQQARYPDALRFGICWQHAPEEAAPDAFDDTRVRVIDVPWQESRGACWARAAIMSLWDNEAYFLQLDSHHRFADGWDARLLAMAEQTSASKPVLTTYGSPYTPDAATLPAGEPFRIEFDRFSEDGIPMFCPGVLPGWQERTRPARARFISAHMLFAPASFIEDVPYDPDLYFTGEEITLAIRAYTHGYDLFHPQQHILWHEFSRQYRVKHWDDHVHARGIRHAWHERDASSRARIRRLFDGADLGRFGLGTQRSQADYEAYAGLSLKHSAVQDATLRHEEPPNPPAPEGWATVAREWRVSIELDRASLPAVALVGSAFWYVGFHAADRSELYRQDADADELRRLLNAASPTITLMRCFVSSARPATWTVWPADSALNWLGKIEGNIL
jgi:hypothetical protein